MSGARPLPIPFTPGWASFPRSNAADSEEFEMIVLTPTSDSDVSGAFYDVAACITPSSADSFPFPFDSSPVLAVFGPSVASVMDVPRNPSSKVTEWVQQQACEDNMAEAAKGDIKTEDPSMSLTGKSRRYKIEYLLQLRFTSNMSSIKLRINPEALQGQ